MRKTASKILSEIENLYVGWIHNPLVDAWNCFADFHNGFVEQKTAKPVSLEQTDEGLSATVDGKRYPIREHWFETDFLRVLSKATGEPLRKLKKGRKPTRAKKRPSKRR